MNFNKVIVMGLFATLMTGCDIGDVMDATKSMPQKMDGMQNGMNATNKKLDQTDLRMADTQHKLHLQTLLVSLTEIMKKENTRSLVPVPFDQLAAGKTFAEEATTDELAEIAFKTFKDIAESSADFDMSLSRLADGSLTPEGAADFNNLKFAKLRAIQVIAGFIPQEKVEKLVDEQINTGAGQYPYYTVQLLALRGAFIEGILVNEKYLSGDLTKTMKTPGTFLDIAKKMESLEYLANSQFFNDLKVSVSEYFVNVPYYKVDEKGVFVKDQNGEKTIDSARPGEKVLSSINRNFAVMDFIDFTKDDDGKSIAARMYNYYSKIDEAYDKGLDPRFLGGASAESVELAQLRDKFKEGAARWKTHLP